jgi:hypothetical protein
MSMKATTLPLFYSAILSLSACQTYSNQAFRFDTNITEEGYKLFQLVYPPRDLELKLPTTRRGNNDQLDKGFSEQQVLKVLEDKLEETGYCTDGYIVLGRQGGETTDRIRGECRDKATESDRQKHPNTIKQW